MRLKSNLWVKAYMRRATSGGAFGAVVRHGDDDAGAIHIIISNQKGDAILFSPAPVYALDEDGSRMWRLMPARGSEINELIQRELKIDPDLWLVEIEDADGRNFLDEGEIYIDQ